jgi:hypothetical protein
MTRIRKRLTMKELKPFVLDYYRAFPHWKLLLPDLFARESGPLIQAIAFERLSYGSYRPQAWVSYLCVPDRDGGLDPQWLNVRLRQIDPRAHERLRDKVVEAIHREIVPSVDAPLDPVQVLALHEAKQCVRSPDAHHLAALNAYLAHEERALYWCMRFPEMVEQEGVGWHDFDFKRRAFLDDLKRWIKAGEAKQQLERIVQEERRKWRLS